MAYFGLKLGIQNSLFYLYFIIDIQVPGFNNMVWLFLFSIRFANTYQAY